MDDAFNTKGILKKPLLTPTAQATSLSWLSRLQSKLTLNPQEDPLLGLQRQDLKRVTFSMGQLTTEHLLYDDTVDSDTQEQQQQQQPQSITSSSSPLSLTTFADYSLSLPYCYERACRLREEKEWPVFMDMLQSHCSSPLTTIDLSGRSINHALMGPLSDIFLLDFGLRTLCLSNCGLDDENISTLLNSLLKTDSITELDISHNPLKTKGYKMISIFIAESKTIISLTISKTSPDLRATQYLSQGLLSTTSLRHLNMDQCALKSIHLDALSPGVSQSTVLTSLSLRYNRFSSTLSLGVLLSKPQQPIDHDGTTEDNIYDYRHYSNTIGLERLDLTGNHLQEATIVDLCQALYHNRALKHLILSHCQIYSNGCENVANALYANECLESLDLSANPILRGSDRGIHAMKTALLRNDTLRQLVLTNTDLDVTAAIMIAEVLPMNTALTRLDLSQNPSISLAGILALSVSVKLNRSITFLDISIPANDMELSDLQNDIAAVCTTNMIQQVEQSQQGHDSEKKTIGLQLTSSLSITSSLSSEATASPLSLTPPSSSPPPSSITIVPLLQQSSSIKTSLDQPLAPQTGIVAAPSEQIYPLNETTLLDPM